jgi:two-component system, NtrC family, sensor histidine kinase HydH
MRMIAPGRRKLTMIVVAVLVLAISCLHYTVSSLVSPLHAIIMDLYYIPVLIGALAFGIKGGMITFASVAVLYFPYIIVVWRMRGLFLAEDLLHTLFFGIFAFVAGFLVDRERKYRKELEKGASLAALGRAAGTVAHELRSPLTVIAGFAAHLQKKKENADAAIRTIIDAAHTMQRIVDSTLDFAKPLQPVQRESDIMEVVGNAVSACKTKAESRGVALSMSLPSRPFHVELDPFLCERAFVNLIDNAIDASRQGQTVHISVIPVEEAARIVIKDFGGGMDKATLENLFIPFFTTKPAGTGIGMALTKKIIESHRGDIKVRSKPGQGTEITVELFCRVPDE